MAWPLTPLGSFQLHFHAQILTLIISLKQHPLFHGEFEQNSVFNTIKRGIEMSKVEEIMLLPYNRKFYEYIMEDIIRLMKICDGGGGRV
jgi:hypothetical protein